MNVKGIKVLKGNAASDSSYDLVFIELETTPARRESSSKTFVRVQCDVGTGVTWARVNFPFVRVLQKASWDSGEWLNTSRPVPAVMPLEIA